MIEINRVEPSYRLCNACRSNDDVYEIAISYQTGRGSSNGVMITLCKNCRKELVEKLNRIDIVPEEKTITISEFKEMLPYLIYDLKLHEKNK